MSRRADTRHFTQQFNVLRAVVKVVVADDAAKRLTTKLTYSCS